jgi:hypothetical protein
VDIMGEAEAAAFYVEQALKCFRLARRYKSSDVARKLRELGDQFAAKALERGAAPSSLLDRG